VSRRAAAGLALGQRRVHRKGISRPYHHHSHCDIQIVQDDRQRRLKSLAMSRRSKRKVPWLYRNFNIDVPPNLTSVSRRGRDGESRSSLHGDLSRKQTRLRTTDMPMGLDSVRIALMVSRLIGACLDESRYAYDGPGPGRGWIQRMQAEERSRLILLPESCRGRVKTVFWARILILNVQILVISCLRGTRISS